MTTFARSSAHTAADAQLKIPSLRKLIVALLNARRRKPASTSHRHPQRRPARDPDFRIELERRFMGK